VVLKMGILDCFLTYVVFSSVVIALLVYSNKVTQKEISKKSKNKSKPRPCNIDPDRC
jgi:hypothetical protein